MTSSSHGTQRPRATGAPVAQQAKDAARQAGDSQWVERAARLGLAARGLVYALIGLLAMQVAFGRHGKEADREGALAAIAARPFGAVVLWLVALGFLGIVMWRLVEAITGPAGSEDTKKAWGKRALSAFKAALYLSFAVSAAHAAMGSSGGKGAVGWTAQIMKMTGGRLLIGLVGLALVAAGAVTAWQGWKTDFEKHLDTGRMSTGLRRTVERLGRFGYIARGVVFALAGVFVIQAALRFNPQKADGLDLALKSLASTPVGPPLLVVVALGLIAFGAYSCAEARFRRL